MTGKRKKKPGCILGPINLGKQGWYYVNVGGKTVDLVIDPARTVTILRLNGRQLKQIMQDMRNEAKP